MKVINNNKKSILKSFINWLPLLIFSSIFYYVVFVGIIMWLLINFLGIDKEQARTIALYVGGIVLILFLLLYLMWVANSLSSYELSIDNDILHIKGKNGWRSIDTKMSISSIQKISLGGNHRLSEKLSFNNRAIQDQVASRLTFFPINGKPFKLNFATKAFDKRSLYDFLKLLQSKGVDIEI